MIQCKKYMAVQPAGWTAVLISKLRKKEGIRYLQVGLCYGASGNVVIYGNRILGYSVAILQKGLRNDEPAAEYVCLDAYSINKDKFVI